MHTHVYTVYLLMYDPRKTPVAFRRSIDDDPDDPDDDKAFPLGGPEAWRSVAKFRHNGLPTTDPAYETLGPHRSRDASPTKTGSDSNLS
jgi:hypothetical protein